MKALLAALATLGSLVAGAIVLAGKASAVTQVFLDYH